MVPIEEAVAVMIATEAGEWGGGGGRSRLAVRNDRGGGGGCEGFGVDRREARCFGIGEYILGNELDTRPILGVKI